MARNYPNSHTQGRRQEPFHLPVRPPLLGGRSNPYFDGVTVDTVHLAP